MTNGVVSVQSKKIVLTPLFPWHHTSDLLHEYFGLIFVSYIAQISCAHARLTKFQDSSLVHHKSRKDRRTYNMR